MEANRENNRESTKTTHARETEQEKEENGKGRSTPKYCTAPRYVAP